MSGTKDIKEDYNGYHKKRVAALYSALLIYSFFSPTKSLSEIEFVDCFVRAVDPALIATYNTDEVFIRSQFLEDQGSHTVSFTDSRTGGAPRVEAALLERAFRIALGVPHPNPTTRASQAARQAPLRAEQPAIFPLNSDLSSVCIFQNGRWLTFRRLQEPGSSQVRYDCIANERTPPADLIRSPNQANTSSTGSRRYTPDELVQLISEQRMRQDEELLPTRYEGTAHVLALSVFKKMAVF